MRVVFAILMLDDSKGMAEAKAYWVEVNE